MNIALERIATGTSARDPGHSISVVKNDTFGVSSRPRGIVDGEDVVLVRRAHLPSRLFPNCFDLGDGVYLYAGIRCQLVQEITLGVTDHLALVQRVQSNDDFQSGNFGSDLEQSRDVWQGANNAGKLAVVDDELGRLRPERLVESDRV